MDIFNNVIWWVNIAVIVIVGSCFVFQLLFMFLFFLKPKRFKKSENKHHFTFIIRACNEEDVIADSVDSCLAVDYPEDRRRVIVFAHNCKDRTAEIARQHGAEVVEITDEDPDHRKASYCMYHGMNALKEMGKEQWEYFLFLDADNQVDKNYLNACNDAAEDGVVLGRTFENSKNLTDNMLSCMTGLWYARDDRFACRGRSALNFGCVMNGCASMVKSEYCLDWDAMSTSDDIEFTLNRLIKDEKKVEYIDEAVVYEDQPTTLDDIFKRNTRMGNGLNKLFWTKGITCLKLFFKNLFRKDMDLGTKFTYLDQFFNLATIPAAFLAVAWFPLYYIYTLIYVGLTGPLVIYGLGIFTLRWFILFIVIVVCACFFFPFLVQPLLSYLSERKRLIVKNKKVLVLSIIFFPALIIIDCASVIKGIFTKPKWEKLKRSKTKVDS